MNLNNGKLVIDENHKHMVCCYWEGCHDHMYKDLEVVNEVTKFIK